MSNDGYPGSKSLGLEGLIANALEKLPAADKETAEIAARTAILGWLFDRCREVYDNEVKFHETLLDDQIAMRMATGKAYVMRRSELSELLGVNKPEKNPNTLQDHLMSGSNALAVDFEGPLTSQHGSDPVMIRGKMLATLPSAEGTGWIGDAYSLQRQVNESRAGGSKNNLEATRAVIYRYCRQFVVKADIESLGGKVLDAYEYRGSNYDLYGRYKYPRGLQSVDDFLTIYASGTQGNEPDVINTIPRIEKYCQERSAEIITCRELLTAVA